MLPAANRLRRRVEFAATVRAGRRSARGPIVVHLAFQPTTGTDPAPAGEDSPVRVGFVIPRAVGSAVERNRVRRRVRHLALEHVSALPAGTSLVIRVLPGGASLPFSALGERLEAAVAAARRPRPPSRRAGA